MGSFFKIDNKEIIRSLKTATRQYFVGNLNKPQELDFFKDEDVEIGVTDYNEFTTEEVHYHTEATEYQYVISGWTKYLNVITHEEYEFKKGDFYKIESNTTYAQKSKAKTRILFIKMPSINDKQVVVTSEKVERWYKEALKTTRTDYFDDEGAPEANSIVPAAAVAIIKNQKILLLKRADSGNWTMPGGTAEIGESLVECAIREVEEETGLSVNIKDIVATYTDPRVKIEYSDGEVRQEFTIVYLGSVENNEVILDDESSGYAWIPLNEVTSYKLAKSQLTRIKDILRYLDTGEKRMR